MEKLITLTKDEFYISLMSLEEYGYSVDIQPKQPITKKQAIQLKQQIIQNPKKIEAVKSYITILHHIDKLLRGK